MNNEPSNETSVDIMKAEDDLNAPSDASLSARVIARIVMVILTVLFFVAALGFLVYWLSGLILLIVLAIFFAYLIAPLVGIVQRPFNERQRANWMPRPLAIGIVYLFMFSALYGMLAYLLPLINSQVSEFAQQAPIYAQTFRARFEEINHRYERMSIPKAMRDSIESGLTKTTESMGEYATTEIGNILLGSVTFLPWIILIPILGFFILKDAALFRLAAVKAFPRGRLRGRAELFLKDVNKSLAAYIRAQLISCLLIGSVCTIGFYLIGVRYALLLGLLAAVLEFIPLVGPLIIGILATLVASFYSGNQAIAVAVFLIVLRMVHDYVTYPRIIQEGIHLHPLAIILSILAGGELAGVTGIFLAIPVVAIATVTYRHLLEHSGNSNVAELLDAGKTDAAVNLAEKKLEQIDAIAEIERANEQETNQPTATTTEA
jgi:predicted PurR-regulated permease PerM